MNVLAIATCGTGGIVKPLIRQLEATFGPVHVVSVWLPVVDTVFFLVASMRLPKEKWWRIWMQLREKTPYAFRRRTNIATRKINFLGIDYDFVVFFGALHDAALHTGKPIFLITDSTRCLSLSNKNDKQCHFKSDAAKNEWLSLEKQVYQKARRIFVGAERVKRSLVMDYGIGQHKVLVTGFGAGFHAEDRPPEGKYRNRQVLFVGKGDFEKKGGRDLVRAFDIVQRKYPDSVLIIVGQENVKSAGNIVSYGFISDAEKLKALMAQANVFVLPSYVDRNPITVIEAMSTYTPCVVSSYGAIPEMVGDAGFVVEPGDHEAIANAIERLFSDPLMGQQMGEKGRKLYEERFNWEKIWQEMSAQIKLAIGGS